MKRVNNRTNTTVVAVILGLSFISSCKADLIHTNQIRAEGLQADRDFVTNNAALNNTLNIKPVNLNDNPYLKSLNNQIQMEQAQNEARREAESRAIEDKWARELYNNYVKGMNAQKKQVTEFNRWARENYSQLHKQAQDGNAVAMYTYAWLLSTHDPERKMWLRSAAEAGHSGAVSALGWLYFEESIRKITSGNIYFKGNRDDAGSYRAFKLGAVEYWTRAAENDDPSALAMCTLIYWSGGVTNEKSLTIPEDKQKALHYLDRLEKIGALTLHDIIAPFLVEPSFFQLLFHQKIHPYFTNAYDLRIAGSRGSETTCSSGDNYRDYTIDGLIYDTTLHLEMIRLEAYPTLWHTRQAAMKGDKKAIEQLIRWGTNHYIETNLDPSLEHYNQWMMQSNLGPINNEFGYAIAPDGPNKFLKRVDPYKPGFYMNDRELQYWSARLKE